MTVEIKANIPGNDIKKNMHEFLHAFEEFKSENDARLLEVERKSSADVLTMDKLGRIDETLTEQKKRLDALSIERNRPIIAAQPHEPAEVSERKSAFTKYVRTGDASQYHQIEAKSLNMTTSPEGGYLAPHETEQLITSAVRHISPIRQIASVRQIGATTFRKPTSINGASAGWVGETDARPETAAPTLAAIDFPTMELYAMPATTQSLLDDSIVDVERWLADEVQVEFAAQEGSAFVSGDGENKPTGFLSYPVVAEENQSWGQVGYIATGTDGDFREENSINSLIDLIYAPKQVFRNNGRFVMNRSVVSRIRKLKDAEGNYLWQPSFEAGKPATLLGYPVTECEEMPSISAGSNAIIFGDFERGYLVVDRVGLRILRDPFSAKPYVLFYTTKRVGGGIQNFDALKILKFSAS